MTQKAPRRMSKQQAFQRSITHLLRQGTAARDKRGNCVYRFDNGSQILMCALGCLIPDSEYAPEMESKNAHYLLSAFTFSTLPRETGDLFLPHLQSLHDNHMGDTITTRFVERVQWFADKFGLNTSFLQRGDLKKIVDGVTPV